MKWPDAVSIKHVALAYIAGLLLLVSLVGGFAVYQTRAVTHSLEQHNQNAAQSELTAAVQRLLSRTEEQSVKLALWDETRQQLVLPEYYAYWRDQRLYESGILNSRHVRAALYGPSGMLLEPSPEAASMPARLPAGTPPHQNASWLIDEAGTVALYYAFPVYSDEQRQTLLGHGLIRLDFMPALLRQNALHFTDIASVSLALKP
ncbi:MAG: GGDEF-domain containing protein, partial [Betaproteobacteria bacterium HGW-Betaproteobacteria-17]